MMISLGMIMVFIKELFLFSLWKIQLNIFSTINHLRKHNLNFCGKVLILLLWWQKSSNVSYSSQDRTIYCRKCCWAYAWRNMNIMFDHEEWQTWGKYKECWQGWRGCSLYGLLCTIQVIVIVKYKLWNMNCDV